jgi:hypothetical protein
MSAARRCVKERSMARKRDTLRYEPMYKPGAAEAKPAKRQSRWKTILRNFLSLVRGQRSIELKTKG